MSIDVVAAGYTRRAPIAADPDHARLNLSDDRVTTALIALGKARADYSKAMGANHVGRPGGARKLADAEAAKDAAFADLERAVRVANVGADEDRIQAATRHLSL